MQHPKISMSAKITREMRKFPMAIENFLVSRVIFADMEIFGCCMTIEGPEIFICCCCCTPWKCPVSANTGRNITFRPPGVRALPEQSWKIRKCVCARSRPFCWRKQDRRERKPQQHWPHFHTDYCSRSLHESESRVDYSLLPSFRFWLSPNCGVERST